MAGYCATPERLAEVRAMGAQGVQVGTLFAFSDESGLQEEHRKMVLHSIPNEDSTRGWLGFYRPAFFTDKFPFKAIRLSGTVSDEGLYLSRKRICDLGYLRHAYKKEDGSVGQRCPAEPVADYVKKGGVEEDTQGESVFVMP